MTCKGIIGWIFGHRFEELLYYSETPAPHNIQNTESELVGLEIVKRKIIYKRIAYCTHCGLKLEEK